MPLPSTRGALPHAALACALLGLAATTAQAQSSVTLYGLLDLSIGRSQNAGGSASKGVDSGKMTTSFFGFKGQEDLGDGLKAVFAIESFMRSDGGDAGRFNGDPFWARSAYVGLSGGMGTLQLGRNTTSLFVNTLLFNAFGDSFGFSPAIRHTFTSGTVSGDTGWSDSIKWASPRWGGWSFSLHGAAGEASGGRNTGVSALYFGGPLSLGLAWQDVAKGATVDDTRSWQLGGAYDLKAVKLFAQLGRVDNHSSGHEHSLGGLGAAVPAGAGKVLLQWGRISPDQGARRQTLSLGYDHTLSPRSDVYVVYMNDQLSGQHSGNSYGLGLRHRF